MKNKAVSKPRQDSGMTLVELLVSISLGLIVLTLLAAMMIGVYGTQDRVTNSSNAANEAQVGSEVFRSAIRSSTGAKLLSVTVDGVPGQLLVTRTLDASNPGTLTPSATCIAFLWKSATNATTPGSIHWAKAASKTLLPLASTSTGWRGLIAEMTPLPAELGGPLVPSVFSVAGNTYKMVFSTEPRSGPQTTISVSAVAPTLKSEVSGGCY